MNAKPTIIDPLIWLLVAVVAISFGFSLWWKKPIGTSYKQSAIQGRVDTIYSYDKGYPVVSVSGLRMTLKVPTGCSEYINKGDSLNKAPNSLLLCINRDLGAYQVTTLWGYSSEGYAADVTGFISSETKKK